MTDRFIAAVEATELSTGERNYLNGYVPVRIGAGRTPAGLRVLRFEFGNTTTIEWDGSEQDAEEIVDQIAENAAENAAGDYWIAGGGWKEWNRRQQQPE